MVAERGTEASLVEVLPERPAGGLGGVEQRPGIPVEPVHVDEHPPMGGPGEQSRSGEQAAHPARTEFDVAGAA